MENKLCEIKEKLTNEDNELFIKILKLEEFINSKNSESISVEHRQLLHIQFNTMKTYHDVLKARINLLNKTILRDD